MLMQSPRSSQTDEAPPMDAAAPGNGKSKSFGVGGGYEKPPRPVEEIADNILKAYQFMSLKFDVGTPDEFLKRLEDKGDREQVFNYMRSYFEVGSFEDFTDRMTTPKMREGWSHKAWRWANTPLPEKALRYIQSIPEQVSDEAAIVGTGTENLSFLGKRGQDVAAQVLYGASRSLAETLLGLTTPLNLTLLGTMGIGGALFPAAGRVASGAFTIDMARHIPDQILAIRDAIQEGDPYKISKSVTDLVTTSYFVKQAGQHALKKPPPRMKAKIEEAEKVVVDAAQTKAVAEALKNLDQALAEEPGTLSPVDSAVRARAIERELAYIDYVNQSPHGGKLLKMRLAFEEAMAERDAAFIKEVNTPALLRTGEGPEFGAKQASLEKACMQSRLGSKLLRRRLLRMQQEAVEQLEGVEKVSTMPSEVEGAKFVMPEPSTEKGVVTYPDPHRRALEARINEDLTRAEIARSKDVAGKGFIELMAEVAEKEAAKEAAKAEGMKPENMVVKSPEETVPRVLKGLGEPEVPGGPVKPGEILRAASNSVAESVRALYELMGGDRLGIVPFSEANYEAAKPHLQKAWAEYEKVKAGFDVFSKDMLDKLGDRGIPYLRAFQAEIMPEAPTKLTLSNPGPDPAKHNEQFVNKVVDYIYERRGETPHPKQKEHKQRQVRQIINDEAMPIDQGKAIEIQRAMELVDLRTKQGGKILPDVPDEFPAFSRRRSPDGLLLPQVSYGDMRAVMESRKMPETKFGYKYTTPRRFMTEMGDRVKETFYDGLDDSVHAGKIVESQVKRAYSNRLRELRKLPAGQRLLPGRKSFNRIGIYGDFKRFEAMEPGRGYEYLKLLKMKKPPKLNKGEAELYSIYRSYFDQLHEMVNEGRKQSGMKPIGYAEDYFPLMRDMAEFAQTHGNLATANVREWNEFIHPRSTRFPFEKEARGTVARVATDADAVFQAYLETATNHAFVGPKIAHLREILKEVTDSKGEPVFSLKTANPHAHNYLTNWLDFVAGKRFLSFESSEWLDKHIFQKLHKHVARSILAGNVRSAGVQLTAYAPAFAEIGTKYLVQGIYDAASLIGKDVKSVVKRGVPTARALAHEGASALLGRTYDAAQVEIMGRRLRGKAIPIKDTALAKVVAGSKNSMQSVEQAMTWLAKQGLTPLTVNDMFTAESVWHGGYRYATQHLNLKHKPAVRWANDLVTRTQASAARHNLAPIQYTALGKAMTLFQTYVIQHWEWLTKDVMGYKTAVVNPDRALIMLRYMLASTAMSIVFEGLLGQQSPFPTPLTAFINEYNDNGSVGKASLLALRELAEPIPIVGGAFRWGSSPAGAVITAVQELAEISQFEEYGWKPYTWEVVGKLLGVPGTSQAAKVYRKHERERKYER